MTTTPKSATHSHHDLSDGITTFFKKVNGVWLQCKQFECSWFPLGRSLDGNSLITTL